MMRILYGSRVLYDPPSGVELLDVELTRSLREAAVLTFKMPRTHPAYGAVELASVDPQVDVYDGPELIMRGRAASCEDVDDVGTVEFTVEGELAYLNDTAVRPYSVLDGGASSLAPNQPYEFFAWLVTNHNARVEPSKQFAVGVNQGHLLNDSSGLLSKDLAYPSTGKAVKELLLDGMGGFVRARYSDGKRYVDLLADTDGTASQRIEFGTNLLKFARTRDGSDVKSVCIPLGKEDEETEERITVKRLSGTDADGYGRYKIMGDRVVSVDLVAKVGYREQAVEFDVVEDFERLPGNAVSWLSSQASEIETVKVSAFDLSRIDPSVKPIRLGDYVRVTSRPHGYDSYMIVSRIVERPGDWRGAEYTFGLEGDDIGERVRKHAAQLNAGVNKAYERAESVGKIAKDAQERADAAKGAADEAQAGADAAKEAADKAKSDAEKAAADALKAAQDALDAKREADEATAKVEVAETDLRVVREAVASAQGAADAASDAAGDAEAKADAANQAATDAKSESQSAFESAANAIVTAEAAQAEAAGAKADADKVRTDLAGQIKTVTDTMSADYSKISDLTQTEARLVSEIERSAAGIASTVAETYAKKTDLTSVEFDLQTKIEQNADAITSTAKSVSEVDAKANNAASEASAASAAASKAQADAADAATDAASAQTAADDAAANLAIAEKSLDAVTTRVGATEEDVKAAEAAVATAKGAADAAQSAATTAKTNAAAAQATADVAKTAAEAAQKAADALGTRVTAAETKIEQNANAITLRATKTEAQGYASTAKSEAVGEAAGDATAKANKAKADAAADAKAKADAALSGAKTYSDAQLKVQADKISANVTETNGLKTRMSTVEQTASGLSVRLDTTDKNVTTAQSTANTAKTNAATAQSTADTAKANAATAQGTASTANSTANTAKTNAATAQSTADTAKTNAATAQSTANTARTEAAAAGKTATNFLEFSSAGLDVGNKTSGKWAGFRTRMAAGSFQVLDAAANVLSSFGASSATIGRADAGNVYIDTASVSVRKGTSVLVSMAANMVKFLGGLSISTKASAVIGSSAMTIGGDGNVEVSATGKVALSSTSASGGVIVSCGESNVLIDGSKSQATYPVQVKGGANFANAVYKGGNSVYAAKILYGNASGTAGTVALSETAANFSMIEIYFKTNDGNFGCAKAWAPNGKTLDLVGVTYNSSASMFTKRRPVLVSGTSISNNGYTGEGRVNSNNSCTTSTLAGAILICYVLGWK